MFTGNFLQVEKDVISQVLKTFQDKTCVRFKELRHQYFGVANFLSILKISDKDVQESDIGFNYSQRRMFL